MFYLIIFLILFALALTDMLVQNKTCTRVLVVLSAIILICIAGLRLETGGDWDGYWDLFYSFPSLKNLLVHPSCIELQDVEELFVLLCAIVKSLGGNIQHVYFIMALINITLISHSLVKYTKYPVLGLLCYYGILYFTNEMIYMRQATAVAICFLAIRYIDSRQIVRYMSLVLLACLIHRVSLLMIPLYFFLNRRFPTWAYLTVVGVGALLMLFNITWMQNIFLTVTNWLGDNYATKAAVFTEKASYAASRSFTIGFGLNLALLVVAMIFHKQIDERKYGTILLNMFAISLIFYYYCFELVEAGNRARLFFYIGFVGLLPILLEIQSRPILRIAGFAAIVLYSFSMSMTIFLETPQSVAYNPYQNYLEFKMHPRPSTGKWRLDLSKRSFIIDRQ